MATQSHKILIGVTGRTDSAVAAYLLKKQGMEVHAVAILFHVQGVSESEDSNQLKIDKNIVQYSLSELSEIKKVYDALEIPFYAVNAQEQYYALVNDPLVAHRLMGRAFNAKVVATQLLFDVLYQKAEVLKAKYVATGHYAKLQTNQKTNESALFSSPDLDSDQSFLLAGLSSQQLSKLMLPLSDMRKAETHKISQIMGIKTEPSIKHLNVFERENLALEIEDFIPSSMIVEGEIILQHDENMLAEHKGVHNFFLGQGAEHGLDLKRSGIERDLVVVDIDAKTGTILVEDPKRLYYTHVSLGLCRFGGGGSSIFPLDVYIQFKEFGERLAGKLYFKNNNSCVLEFTQKQLGVVVAGTTAVIYSKSSGVARVFAHGIVQGSFHMIKGHARRFAPTDPDDDEEIELSHKNQMGF